jgi:hypothetical protein
MRGIFHSKPGGIWDICLRSILTFMEEMYSIIGIRLGIRFSTFGSVFPRPSEAFWALYDTAAADSSMIRAGMTPDRRQGWAGGGVGWSGSRAEAVSQDTRAPRQSKRETRYPAVGPPFWWEGSARYLESLIF